MIAKQWEMFQKDVTKLIKFMRSPDGIEMDDKNMKAFLTDMENVFNKHLMKNDIRIS